MDQFKEALQRGKWFIEPALRSSDSKKVNPSIPVISRLSERLPQDQKHFSDDSLIRAILYHAIDLLLSIENVMQDETEDIWNSSSVEVIYGLMDLIMLEGIVPFFPPGVGFSESLRPKSLLDGQVRTQAYQHQNFSRQLLSRLTPLLSDRQKPITAMVRDRYLGDIIAAVAELAYGPSEPDHTHSQWQPLLDRIVQESPSQKLLPVLSVMLHSATPPWLRDTLSRYLSLIPLRPFGVRQTIEFIASSFHTSQTSNPQPSSDSSKGPPLPLEALVQVSNLLSRVPSTIKAQNYFSTLAPQLWDLLDGKSGLDMSRAAGHIICGILSKRQSGAPGSVGWNCFAAPLINCIDPPGSTSPVLHSTETGLAPLLVSEFELQQALKRMILILESQSNPGVTSRMLGPSIMSLWGIAAFGQARSAAKSSLWVTYPMTLLRLLLRLTTKTGSYLDMIVSDILYDGRENYKFAAGGEGGIEIRARDREQFEYHFSQTVGSRVEEFNLHTDLFMVLLNTAGIAIQHIVELLLSLTKIWSNGGQPHASSGNKILDPIENNAQQRVTATIIVPKILTQYQDSFAKHPVRILELGKQLLERFVLSPNEDKPPKKQFIERLVRESRTSGLDASKTIEDEEILSLSLSLFTLVTVSPEFKLDDENRSLLASVDNSLEKLKASHALSDELLVSVNSLSTLLKALDGLDIFKPQMPLIEDQKAITAAQSIFTNSKTLPYERIEASKNIHSMIQRGSPAIDAPALTLLFIEVIRGETDEAVYLSTINGLVLLSQNYPRISTRLTLDAFVDKDEKFVLKEGEVSPVDARLRIGEALTQIAEKMQDQGGTTTTLVAEGAIKVAGRRGERPKTLRERQKILRAEEAEKVKAERADLADFKLNSELEQEPEDETSSKLSDEDRAVLEQVLRGWEDTGLEEDVRIRSSALSVLSAVLQHHWQSLTKDLINTAVDLALAILNLETTAEKAILRRGSVFVIMALLHAVEIAKEETLILEPGKWDEVNNVISWTVDADEDVIAKGHAEQVKDSLANLRMRLLFGLDVDGNVQGYVGTGLEELRGINVHPLEDSSSERRKAIIEELD